MRTLYFVYGILCYVAALAVFGYLAGFLLEMGVPRSVSAPDAGFTSTAILVDVGLLLLFALQHSIMARPTFKSAWMRIVPEPIERSTYVLFSCLALGVLFWLWQPIGNVVWQAGSGSVQAGLYGLYGIGWAIVLAATFLLNHFDLFGLRQVWLQFRERPYSRLTFATPVFYRIVRHPLYVGWLLVFWAAPVMTMGRLIFAVGQTIYILVAIKLEERNLLEIHGQDYAEYRRRVPMLVPGLKRATG